ncbi:hypothetical protein BJ166DRAFT_591769 [Pestalotiopsis sp. NC0098]|nr:hypothetical protein BJ166DRAFT_591769 [Pestalotiopsis sp. NC0098]
MAVEQSSDGVRNTSEPETIRPELGRAPCYVVSATTGPTATHVPTSPDALRRELGDVSTLGTDSKYLVVVHGLPTAFVQVLVDELGMDPDFVRAVASRRRFKPKQGRQDHGSAIVASYEYPLLLDGVCSAPLYDSNDDYDEIYGQTADEMEKPLVCPTSSSGSDGVVFCRVAAWQCDKKTVLFLDRPWWQDPSSSDRPENAGEMNTLVSQVWECRSSDEPAESLPSTIEAAVHEHWVEFLDTLQPGMDSTTSGAVSLACEVQRRLETNLTASSLSSGGSGPGLQAYGYVRPNWQALLDRSERHRRLAFDIASLRARLEQAVPVLWPPDATEKPRQPWYPDDMNTKPQPQPPMGAEENQRSLDRVSYLGGVLLPVSIVSGILSMGDTFGPGGDLFYVFWAAGVPLTVLTLLVIYADSIRREVVYVQTNHSRGHSSGSGSGSGEDDKTGWNRMGRVGQDEPVVVPMPDLESGYPPAAHYSEQIPISVSEPAIAGSPVASLSLPPQPPPPVLEKVSSEPVATLQPRFGRKREKHHDHGGTWERRELGWMGAAMCMLRLSELKKEQRLPRAVRR